MKFEGEEECADKTALNSFIILQLYTNLGVLVHLHMLVEALPMTHYHTMVEKVRLLAKLRNCSQQLHDLNHLNIPCRLECLQSSELLGWRGVEIGLQAPKIIVRVGFGLLK